MLLLRVSEELGLALLDCEPPCLLLVFLVWPQVSVRICQFHQIQAQLRWLTAHFRTKTRSSKSEQRRKRSRTRMRLKRSHSRTRSTSLSGKSRNSSRTSSASNITSESAPSHLDSEGDDQSPNSDSSSDSGSSTDYETDTDNEDDSVYDSDEEDEEVNENEEEEEVTTIHPMSQRPFVRSILNAYRRIQRCRKAEDWSDMEADFEMSVRTACKEEMQLGEKDAALIIKYYKDTWFSSSWRGVYYFLFCWLNESCLNQLKPQIAVLTLVWELESLGILIGFPSERPL